MSQQQAKQIGNEPAFVCTYGPSGLGKTTDILYTMPRGFYFATPAALKPSIGTVGFNLHPTQVWEPPRIAAMTAMLPKLSKEFDGVVCDDFSLLAERTLSVLEKSKSGFKLWGALRDEITDFRDAARSCGMHVIMNAHESAPQTKNGRFIRGGPKLPSTLTEDFPVQCDIVLRAFPEPSRKGAWPVVYRCTPLDTQYISKDRNSATPDMSPMNLGEILRSAGYNIRRAPGLEWMDDMVERIAQAAAQNPPEQHPALAQAIIANIVQTGLTKNPLHIRWALRDGFDRWTLRVARANNILSGFLAPAGPVGLQLAPAAPAPGLTAGAPAAPGVGTPS